MSVGIQGGIRQKDGPQRLSLNSGGEGLDNFPGCLSGLSGFVFFCPCEQVLSLNTSHSPFLSAPEALVQQLISVGEQQRQPA